MSRRVLFLVPDDYGALERKGVAGGILSRDEHGFFDRVITVHPIAMRTSAADLNERHRLLEFDLGRRLRGGALQLAGTPLRALGMLARLVRLVREERIDLIRATDPFFMGLLAWALSRLTGRPFCVSIHADYDHHFALTPVVGRLGLLRRLARGLPSVVLRRADLVLPIRGNLARWAEQRGAAPERIRVIPHGIDMRRFPAGRVGIPPDLGIPADAELVTFVGRLSRYNYVHEVVDAAARLLAERPRLHVVLLGDGEEREGLERRCEREGLGGRLHLVGFRPAPVVAAAQAAAGAVLAPRGGFSLLEACAAGAAVVVYDVDWHRDVIVPGETGILLSEHDVDGMVAAARQLLDDPARARRLGGAARAFVAEHFDERRTSDTKRACYQLLLDAEPAP